jgi:acyl dehydratase
VAVNKDYAGRAFPETQPYEVSRVKIAEFANAIGDPNPVYRDRDAAVAAGYPDVIAPPTFPIVVTMAASGQALADPGLGINYALVVHGEQRFSYARPLRAGDVVTAQSTIETIKTLGRNTVMTTRTEVRTVAGEPVCTAFSTLVERGTAGEAE